MFIENFITKIIRHKSKNYLKFNKFESIDVPNPPNEKIELYVHIPFCKEICPYCTFHSFPLNKDIAKTYFNALRQELKMYYDNGYKFESVYIGGGTPTILMDELIKTIDLINQIFSPKEISVETNPDHLKKEELKELVQRNVSRVSVGVQSFNDKILRSIGRYDRYGSGGEIKKRVEDVLGIIPTLNIDMIFNFPIQTREMLEKDLEIIEKLNSNQVTFYPLMISDYSKKTMEKLMGNIDYKKEALFYDIIVNKLSKNYKLSSVWCFSKKEVKTIDEYIIKYGEYAGVGSGAFGFIGNTIYANTFSLKEYINLIYSKKFPIRSSKEFCLKEKARYDFLMNLFGLELDRNYFKKKYNKDVCEILPLECAFFSLINAIKIEKEKIKLTKKGRYYWVIMMREFFIGVDNFRDINKALIKEEIKNLNLKF